jgi:hypothetical protein
MTGQGEKGEKSTRLQVWKVNEEAAIIPDIVGPLVVGWWRPLPLAI